MSNPINKKIKTISFVLISIILIFFAVLIYLNHKNLLQISASLNKSPGTLCISGKMIVDNKKITEKCFFDLAKDVVEIPEIVYLEKNQPYTVTYTMGDFDYHQIDGDLVYKAPYLKCIQNGKWDYINASLDVLPNFIFAGISPNFYDPKNFKNIKTKIGNRRLPDVNYHNAPTPKEGDKQDNAGRYDTYYGVIQNKPRGFDFDQIPDLDLDAHCQQYGDIYYAGTNQPGAYSVIEFTPIDYFDGIMLGQTLSPNRLTPFLNGCDIRVNYKVMDNLGFETSKEGSSDDSFLDDGTYMAGGKVITSVNQSNNEDDINAISSGEIGLNNLKTLVSTGSSLWFNLILAVLLASAIGYLMFRDDIWKKNK